MIIRLWNIELFIALEYVFHLNDLLSVFLHFSLETVSLIYPNHVFKKDYYLNMSRLRQYSTMPFLLVKL